MARRVDYYFKETLQGLRRNVPAAFAAVSTAFIAVVPGRRAVPVRRRVGLLVVAIIMLVSAAALVGNTGRLAVFNRRKEIGIMRLVGATSWHIRMPFLIEGTIEGLLGAGAAILGLFIMKVSFIDPLRGKIGFFLLGGAHKIVHTVPL